MALNGLSSSSKELIEIGKGIEKDTGTKLSSTNGELNHELVGKMLKPLMKGVVQQSKKFAKTLTSEGAEQDAALSAKSSGKSLSSSVMDGAGVDLGSSGKSGKSTPADDFAALSEALTKQTIQDIAKAEAQLKNDLMCTPSDRNDLRVLQDMAKVTALMALASRGQKVSGVDRFTQEVGKIADAVADVALPAGMNESSLSLKVNQESLGDRTKLDLVSSMQQSFLKEAAGVQEVPISKLPVTSRAEELKKKHNAESPYLGSPDGYSQ